MRKTRLIAILAILILLIGCDGEGQTNPDTTASIKDKTQLQGYKEPYQKKVEKESLATIKSEFSLDGTVVGKNKYTSELDQVDYYYITVAVYDSDHHSPYTLGVDENQFNKISKGEQYRMDFYYIFSPTVNQSFRIQSSLLEYRVSSASNRKEPYLQSVDIDSLPTIKAECSLEGMVVDKDKYTSELDQADNYYITVAVYDSDHHSPYTLSVDKKQFNKINQGEQYRIDFYYIFSPTDNQNFRIQTTVLDYEKIN